MRSKAQLLKTASTLKQFSSKIKQAQDGINGLGNGGGDVLTPEAVQDIALEIAEVAEVASELAQEIAENVPAENGGSVLDRLNGENDDAGPEQIEVAADETEEEKKKRMEKTAADDEDDDDKKKLQVEVASMKNELNIIKRAGLIEKLATKYASLFPKNMKEAKMNEILTSKEAINIIQTRVQEASDIITNKTMIKVASMNDSIYSFDDSENEEVSISAKL